MNQPLPFSQASENNKQVILDVLKCYLKSGDKVLEIASGTGQHAVFIAENMPELHWQSSDISSNVESLNLRISAAQLENLPAAIPLDVNQEHWPCDVPNSIFSANSLHIMSADSVENFFAGVCNHLKEGHLLVYGPFKYGGNFTSESNAGFDLWLKDRNPESGIRDFEWVDGLTKRCGFQLTEDHVMPANNQLLVWNRESSR